MASEPLSQEDRAALRAGHTELLLLVPQATDAPECEECGEPWPCPMIRALDALDAAEQEAGAPRAQVARLEAGERLYRAAQAYWDADACESRVPRGPYDTTCMECGALEPMWAMRDLIDAIEGYAAVRAASGEEQDA